MIVFSVSLPILVHGVRIPSTSLAGAALHIRRWHRGDAASGGVCSAQRMLQSAIYRT